MKINKPPTSKAEVIIAKFKAMDFNDPDLDLTDISNEVMSLGDEGFDEFFTKARAQNVIDDEDDDGWEWVNPLTGKNMF